MIYNKINSDLQHFTQVKVLDALCDFLTRNTGVKALISRGSIAKGTADYLSDVDLVIVTKNGKFYDFMTNSKLRISPLMVRLTEGSWIDSNVPDFGGLGYVDLIKLEGKLLQLDTYILPEENYFKLNNLNDKKVLYQQGRLNFLENLNTDDHRFKKDIAMYTGSASEGFQILFDVVLHFFMLHKYILRNDPFLSYKYWYLLNAKYLFYLRTCLDKSSRDFNFYDVRRQLNGHNTHELLMFEEFLVNAPANLLNIMKLNELFNLFESTLKKYSLGVYNEYGQFGEGRNLGLNKNCTSDRVYSNRQVILSQFDNIVLN